MWLADAPKEVQDEKLLRKACNIAAYLDPSLAAKAEIFLGAVLLGSGKREDAADCFARVLKADPDNKEAKRQLSTLNVEIVARCKKDLTALKAALQPCHDLKWAE